MTANKIHCRMVVKPLKNRAVRRSSLIATFVLALLAGAPMKLWSRIRLQPYTVDLTEFAAEAPIILRGKVLDISVRLDAGNRVWAVAQFQVDRWYRNGGADKAAVYFQPYDAMSAVN